jgi:hypothetical protein
MKMEQAIIYEKDRSVHIKKESITPKVCIIGFKK